MKNSHTEKGQNQLRNIGQKPSHEAVFMNVSKKAEKIGTALYMVTDLIDVSDPMRQRIRQRSIDLIGETRSMNHAFSGDVYFMVARAISTAWEMVSLIEVSSSVGFISDMNARVLKGVLIELISSLKDKQKREGFSQIDDLKIGESLSGQITLSKNLFDTKDVSYKQDVVSDNINVSNEKVISHAVAKTEKPPQISQSIGVSNATRLEFKESKPKSSERKPKILEIIKTKGEVNVQDIMGSFPDVSSKTIQRELTALVDENILKRVGEKRWSKYSLSQN